jgi:hypothetical protein
MKFPGGAYRQTTSPKANLFAGANPQPTLVVELQTIWV